MIALLLFGGAVIFLAAMVSQVILPLLNDRPLLPLLRTRKAQRLLREAQSRTENAKLTLVAAAEENRAEELEEKTKDRRLERYHQYQPRD